MNDMIKTLEQEFGPRLVRLSNGQPGLRAGLSVETTVPDGEAEPVIDFRSSDETLDRYGEIIVARGWRLDQYRRNPVVQNSHRYDSIADTIGKALVTEVRGNHLFQRVRFAVEENPLGRLAYKLYKGGFLHAVSVGFLPCRWENGGERDAFKRRYLEQELLEVSAVSVPANPNALALAIKAGAVTRQDLEELSELLRIAITGALPARAQAATMLDGRIDSPCTGDPHQATGAPDPAGDGVQWLWLARELQCVLKQADR